MKSGTQQGVPFNGKVKWEETKIRIKQRKDFEPKTALLVLVDNFESEHIQIALSQAGSANFTYQENERKKKMNL